MTGVIIDAKNLTEKELDKISIQICSEYGIENINYERLDDFYILNSNEYYKVNIHSRGLLREFQDYFGPKLKTLEEL